MKKARNKIIQWADNSKETAVKRSGSRRKNRDNPPDRNIESESKIKRYTSARAVMATAQPKTAPTVQNTASAGTGYLRYKLIRENVGAISDKQIPPKNNEEFVSKN